VTVCLGMHREGVQGDTCTNDRAVHDCFACEGARDRFADAADTAGTRDYCDSSRESPVYKILPASRA
jgi:hypothetical protein